MSSGVIGRPAASRLQFGPFTLDESTWQLSGRLGALPVPPRLVAMLAFLARRPGDVITKEELLSAFWAGVTVTENSVARAISDLRSALGDDPVAPRYLQTVARRGYRFIAAVSIAPPLVLVSPTPGMAVPGPFDGHERGRNAWDDVVGLDAWVDTLERDAQVDPSHAEANAALALALLRQHRYRATVATGDGSGLARAVAAARRACDLAPRLGNAWTALACTLAASGRVDEAHDAHELAAALEPHNGRHPALYAEIAWGHRCLEAFDTARQLGAATGLGTARVAMVHVARGQPDMARRVVADLRGHDDASGAEAGLDYVAGLLDLADGDGTAADAAWQRAIRVGGASITAAGFVLCSHVAAGLWRLRSGHPYAALLCFVEALRRFPAHPAALLGLQWTLSALGAANEASRMTAAVAAGTAALARAGAVAEATMIGAAALAGSGSPDEAMSALREALAIEPTGSLGWALRIDPLFHALRAHQALPGLLDVIAGRAF